MTELPTPYEQGFRDALISTQAAFTFACQAFRRRDSPRALLQGLQGTEYETGVLALLEEVARLKAAAEPKPDLISIVVNGKECVVERGEALTYGDLVNLANGRHREPGAITYRGFVSECVEISGHSVTFHGKAPLSEFSGSLGPGCSIVATPGTVFIVALSSASGEVASGD